MHRPYSIVGLLIAISPRTADAHCQTSAALKTAIEALRASYPKHEH